MGKHGDSLFCTKCGKENTTEAIVCSGCGAPISKEPGSKNGDHRWVRRLAWIVWGMTFVPLLWFIIIANIMGSDAGGFDEPFTLKYALFAIGAMVLAIAFVLRWAFGKWIRSAARRDLLVVLLPGGLSVAIGIYGLIIFITNNADFVSLYLLIGIAAVSLIFMRPTSKAGHSSTARENSR
jgi:hypothetical protein